MGFNSLSILKFQKQHLEDLEEALHSRANVFGNMGFMDSTPAPLWLFLSSKEATPLQDLDDALNSKGNFFSNNHGLFMDTTAAPLLQPEDKKDHVYNSHFLPSFYFGACPLFPKIRENNSHSMTCTINLIMILTWKDLIQLSLDVLKHPKSVGILWRLGKMTLQDSLAGSLVHVHHTWAKFTHSTKTREHSLVRN